MLRFLKKLKNSSKKNRARREVEWVPAPDIFEDLKLLADGLKFSHIPINNIKAFRSFGSKAYARARIWAFPKVWQLALNLPPYYVIEVISEKFDHLSEDDRKRVLIHELMHIPKNFSGSLVSHRGRYHRISHRTVEELFNKYQESK